MAWKVGLYQFRRNHYSELAPSSLLCSLLSRQASLSGHKQKNMDQSGPIGAKGIDLSRRTSLFDMDLRGILSPVGNLISFLGHHFDVMKPLENAA